VAAAARGRLEGAAEPRPRADRDPDRAAAAFLASGAEQAGGTAAKQLTGALDGVRNWKGWTGSVTIDPANGNRQPATVVIVDTDAKGQLHVDEAWAKAVKAPY
jgi:ABC-type branched-subunit amino acid transport system substrate-binding protein